MSLITPGLHCRYDWVLVSWGGGTGTYADPESYVMGGPTLTTFFFCFVAVFFFVLFFCRGSKYGPSVKRQMTQRGCWLGSVVIFQMIRTSLVLRNPILLGFLGGSGPPATFWIRA